MAAPVSFIRWLADLEPTPPKHKPEHILGSRIDFAPDNRVQFHLDLAAKERLKLIRWFELSQCHRGPLVTLDRYVVKSVVRNILRGDRESESLPFDVPFDATHALGVSEVVFDTFVKECGTNLAGQ